MNPSYYFFRHLLVCVAAFILVGTSLVHAQSPEALFVVKSSGSLNAMDIAFKNRLEALGYQVVPITATSATASSANGKALVVVSGTVVSGDVNTKFRDTTVPVVVMEQGIHDDMKMTGTVSGTDYGTASSQTTLTITNPGSPLAAGLTGNVTLASAARTVYWGKPAATASVIATQTGNANRALIFAYETGTQMVGLVAPGRRVGFFMSDTGSDDWTNEVWDLFDAAIDWAGRVNPALFVVGNTTLSTSDLLVKNRLEALGFVLTTKSAASSVSADASGKSLVVISASVIASDVMNKFRTSAVPVVTWEFAVWHNLGLVASNTTTDRNTISSQTQVKITNPTHPLAARRSGTVTVTAAASGFYWGKALASAIKVGEQPANATQGFIFAYEQGAALQNLTAPARRVALFPQDSAFANLNDSGWAFFDAAMHWAIEAPPSADSDADGLPDSWEIQYFGNLFQTGSGNPDGDGRTNAQEYADGTDPTVPQITDTTAPTVNITSPIKGENTNPGGYSTDLTLPGGAASSSGDQGVLGGNNTGYGAGAVVSDKVTYLPNGTLSDGFNHHWLSGPGLGSTGWLAYDFGSGNAKRISKYTMISSESGRAPSAWTFEGSQDGTSWSILDTRSAQNGWSPGVKREYTFANGTAYRHFRWNFTANNGGNVLDVDEIELMENLEALHITTSTAVNLAGNAQDNVGVSSVIWTNLTTSAFGNGALTGTNWTASSLGLNLGTNTFRVIARDAAGNSAHDTLKVWRQGIAAMGVTPSGSTIYTNTMIGAFQNRNFVVTNTGTANLVGTVKILGTAFSVPGSTNFNILPNKSQTIGVRYSPTTFGTATTNTVSFVSGSTINRTIIGSTYQDGNNNDIPDQWEFEQFGSNYLSGGIYAAGGDADSDLISNFDEFLNGTNPNDPLNGMTPQIVLLSGNNQTGLTNNFLPRKLVAVVKDASTGNPIANANVQFWTTAGTLTTDKSVPGATSLYVRTNPLGEASVYMKMPGNHADITTGVNFPPAAEPTFSLFSRTNLNASQGGDWSSSVVDLGGSKYRKLSLNGRPIPAGKPQNGSQSDDSPDETYVDAMTLHLNHRVSDISVPAPGGEMNLAVVRQYSPDTFQLHQDRGWFQRPENCFGTSWSSSLTPHYVITTFKQWNFEWEDWEDEKTTYTVTDEVGQKHKFLFTGWDFQNGFYHLRTIPLPNGRTEEIAELTGIVDTSTWISTITLKKKYGLTIVFEPKGSNFWVEEGNRASEINVHRCTHITDRYQKVRLRYFYDPAKPNANSTIVPDEIRLQSDTGTIYSTLKITKQWLPGNVMALVTQIEDPLGKIWQYEYDGSTSQPKLINVKAPSVPGGQPTTTYTYEGFTEPNPDGQAVEHLSLKSIRDPRLNTIIFDYVTDTSRFHYEHGNFKQSIGNTRLVRKVTLPGANGFAEFINHSHLKIQQTGSNAGTFVGHRASHIIDVMGNSMIYEFQDSDAFLLENEQIGLDASWPWMVYHAKTRVHHLKGKTVTWNDTPGSFSFNYSPSSLIGIQEFEFNPFAGLALKSSKDFDGNATVYSHDDLVGQKKEFNNLTGTFLNYFLYHREPTAVGNAIGGVRKYKYDPTWRVMTESIDELGRKAVTAVNSLGLQQSEKIYAPGASQPSKHTDFFYQNPNFPAFMTGKTVNKLAGDPAWGTSIVTSRIADSKGRIQQEMMNPGGLNLVTQFAYNDNNQKISITDPKGNITRYFYDNAGRLERVEHPAVAGVVKTTLYFYDLAGNKVKQVDENSIATLYVYDEMNRLLRQIRDMNGNEIEDSPDLVTTFTYNKLGDRTTVTDPNGNTTTMVYDELQRLVQTIDPDGNITAFEYGLNSSGSTGNIDSFKATKATDPRGFVTSTVYDKYYRPVTNIVQFQLSPALYATNITIYDASGNVRFSKDPLGNTSEVQYDFMNRPVKTITADGKVTEVFFTSTGLGHKVKDALGRESDTIFDAVGRPIEVLQPPVDDGSGTMVRPSIKTAYDAASLVTNVTNPRGFSWVTQYDERGRKIQEKGPAVFDYNSGTSKQPVTEYTYDGVGKLLSVKNPRGHVTSNFYDAAYRVTKVQQPALATNSVPTVQKFYDKNGNTIRLIDPKGIAVTNFYDKLNRVTNTTDAVGIKIFYTYDQVGNRRTVKDGRGVTSTFDYDGFNRMTKITEAMGKVESFTFNAMNKVSRTAPDGRVTQYEYDVRNRLKKTNFVSRPQDNREYFYDDVGNLSRVQEPGKGGKADVIYEYDNLSRVVRETSQGKVNKYSYDLAGNRIKTIYDEASPDLTINSTYDALNRLATMTEGVRTSIYEYDLNGNVRKKQKQTGTSIVVTTIQVFDALNRMTSSEDKNGSSSTLSKFVNSFDTAGNVTKIVETHGNSFTNRTVLMGYDKVYRLTSEKVIQSGVTNTTLHWYDKGFNRVSNSVAGVKTIFRYNALNQVTNMVTGSKQVFFTYDTNGNRTSRKEGANQDTYAYDDDNRLVQVLKSGTTHNYTYDYRTRRVERVEGTTTTKVVFSGGLSVAEFDNGAATPTVQYVRGSDYGGGIGGVLYTLRGGNPSFNLYNERGDVTGKVNSSGSLTYQAKYEGFGTHTVQKGSTLDRQRANTKDEDPTGLLNEGFRYRDLETGTFLTADPLGFVDGPNRYTYVKQNPWTKFDPLGLCEEWGCEPEEEEEYDDDTKGHDIDEIERFNEGGNDGEAKLPGEENKNGDVTNQDANQKKTEPKPEDKKKSTVKERLKVTDEDFVDPEDVPWLTLNQRTFFDMEAGLFAFFGAASEYDTTLRKSKAIGKLTFHLETVLAGGLAFNALGKAVIPAVSQVFVSGAEYKIASRLLVPVFLHNSIADFAGRTAAYTATTGLVAGVGKLAFDKLKDVGKQVRTIFWD
jgi:RHS repeat-associated protein